MAYRQPEINFYPEEEPISENKYQEYERMKQRIIYTAKSPEEYEFMISELVDELGI